VAGEMMEEGVSFSPCSLQLTRVFDDISVWRLCWTGKMLKCIFMLLKPRLNTSVCVYGRNVILKNCIIVKKHLDHRMHLVTKMSTYSLAVISPFTLIIETAEYQDIAAQIVTDVHPCFAVGTRHSEL
jgi:hypothetical protein